MLAVIVVAALTPNVGVVSAQVNAQYTSVTSGPSTLEYALIGVLVAAIVAALVGLMIFQRRKKRGGSGGVAAWQEPTGAGQGPSSGTGGGAGGLSPADTVAAGALAGGGVAAAASYDETAPAAEPGPEWAEPEAPATMGSGAVAPPMDESEPDIDRLMKELDQISDDILKKTPPKKSAPTEPSADEEADSGQ